MQIFVLMFCVDNCAVELLCGLGCWCLGLTGTSTTHGKPFTFRTCKLMRTFHKHIFSLKNTFFKYIFELTNVENRSLDLFPLIETPSGLLQVLYKPF